MLALRARSPCLFARGRCPLCTPFVGAQLPKQVARLGFYPQSGGRSAPPTPGDFPVAGKVTKGAPRAAPFGIPRCVVAALFALAYASRRATFRHNKRPICHFEMVGKSVLFFPLVSSREHSLFSIRGSAGLPSRMPLAFLPATNTARAQGGGIKGGYAPFAGGPGTRRFLVSLW